VASVDEVLSRVDGAVLALIRSGEAHHGLFPSIIDRATLRMPEETPPLIAGQRDSDRAHRGCNLTHDEPTLFTMYALGDAASAAAADRYIERFVTHCTDTVSGLFPWGEHAYWNFDDDAPGNSVITPPGKEYGLTHDHLRACPLWLWEKLHAADSESPLRFGRGLDQHWRPGPPRRYIRHGYINDLVPWEPNPNGSRSSADFPRHGGFYIFDWAYAYSVSEDDSFLSRIREMVDYWWPLRRDDGLLALQSFTRPEVVRHHGLLAPGQTLSLAASLLEAADLLEGADAALTETMRQRAAVYIDGFLAAPHDMARGLFILTFKEDAPADDHRMSVWGSSYGQVPAAYLALVCNCVYRLTGDERLLAWARAAGSAYLTEPFPRDLAVPAMDAGMGLGLLADLGDISGDASWISGGLARCEELMQIYFDDDHALPRGAAGISWYDGQMGPGFLLHGMARLALLARDGAACALAADYTGR
jgi:hypothetical protein